MSQDPNTEKRLWGRTRYVSVGGWRKVSSKAYYRYDVKIKLNEMQYSSCLISQERTTQLRLTECSHRMKVECDYKN